MTRDELRPLLSDVDVLALTLWGEARGESTKGKQAVACVIRNRMRERHQTATEVCWAPWQFSCWIPQGGEQNYAAVMSLADQLAHDPTAPCPQSLCECLAVAEDVLKGAAEDVTHGASHYLTTALFASKPPRWAQTMRVTAVIGGHTFLTDRPLAA